MIPTSTATGITAITPEKLTTKMISNTAAVKEESLPRPPEVKLMILWPIIAHPAMPPNSPEVILPVPNAIHSWFPEPRLPPISSSTESVKSDSIRPTSATISATGSMIIIESQVNRFISGNTKAGKETLERSARSPTTLVSICKKYVTRVITTIAISPAGAALVSLGKKYMVAMVSATVMYMM